MRRLFYSLFFVSASCVAAATTFDATSLARLEPNELTATCRAKTDSRIKEIKETPNLTPPPGATVHYLSPQGDDTKDGLTPATAWRTTERLNRAKLSAGSYVLFARGGTWRTAPSGAGYSPGRPYLGWSGGVRCQDGVTYSAYGTGPKPVLTASPFNGGDPKLWQSTDAPNVWACSLGRTDVGNVVFDEGAAWGIKIVPVYRKDGSTTAQYTGRPFRDYRDLDRDLLFYHDWSTNGIGRGTGLLYVYSRENPGYRFKSIEFGLRHHIMTAHARSNVTVDNLRFAFGGAHGVAGSQRELRVQNCEFAWIGGGVQGENLFGRAWPVRYGNAVEVGACDGFTVSNCWISQVYDAGLTHQGDVVSRFNGKRRTFFQKRIRYVDNVIENCNYSIEYFINACPPDDPSAMDDFVISGNLMWNAGVGLCEQRPDRNQDAHVKSWRHSNRARGYVIRDNLFAYAHRQLIEVCSDLTNADGKPSLPQMENNLFLGSSEADFGCVMQFPDTKARIRRSPMNATAEAQVNALGGGNRVVARSPTQVLFLFDTEDFVNPEAPFAAKRLADILAEEGVKGNFNLVGLWVERCLKDGRKDVLDSLRGHVIGSQTWGHSVHPNICELSDFADWNEAYRNIDRVESQALSLLRGVFGPDAVRFACPPGNSKSYVAMYWYANQGVPIWADSVVSDRIGSDYWGCNAMHFEYNGCNIEGGFVPWGESDAAIPARVASKLEKHAALKRVIIWTHPCKGYFSQFWDDVNYRGVNKHPFGRWEPSPSRTEADRELYFRTFRAVVRAYRDDPRFQVTDFDRLLAAQKPRRPLTPADVPALRTQLDAAYAPVVVAGEPYALHEVLVASARFLTGSKRVVPGKAWGLLDDPIELDHAVTLGRADLVAAARSFDADSFLRPSYEIGDAKLGPGDLLYAFLAACATQDETITLKPHPPLSVLDVMPRLKDMSLKGQWLHSPEFQDAYLSKRLRLQFPTFRSPTYARSGKAE